MSGKPVTFGTPPESCCPAGTCRTDQTPATHAAEMQRIQFSVAGCSRASEAVELTAWLRGLHGVVEAVVNPITERAVVRLNPSLADVSFIFELLDARGLRTGFRLARWHLPAPGLVCAQCASRVEAAVRRVPGVEGATVNLDADELTIEFIPSEIEYGQIHEVLRSDPAGRADRSDRAAKSVRFLSRPLQGRFTRHRPT